MLVMRGKTIALIYLTHLTTIVSAEMEYLLDLNQIRTYVWVFAHGQNIISPACRTVRIYQLADRNEDKGRFVYDTLYTWMWMRQHVKKMYLYILGILTLQCTRPHPILPQR